MKNEQLISLAIECPTCQGHSQGVVKMTDVKLIAVCFVSTECGNGHINEIELALLVNENSEEIINTPDL